jgi:hypothetical protein
VGYLIHSIKAVPWQYAGRLGRAVAAEHELMTGRGGAAAAVRRISCPVESVEA